MKALGLRTILVVVCLSFALVAAGGVAGSKHDFSGNSWSKGELCIVCHTPHNADTTSPSLPLWNHETTMATYTLYSSATLNATLTQPEHYGSKLCLSCHDGTVAVDSFGGASGTTKLLPGNKGFIGTDLRGTHPIGLVYDSALATADGGLHDPETTTTVLGNSIRKDLLFNTGNLECASCHDVHNAQSAATNANLLRITKDGSKLCLTCHDK